MSPFSACARGKIAFDQEHRGFRFLCTYLTEPEGEALIEIFRGESLVKSARWPAYKVWNIFAHMDEIADDLESGLACAGSTGLGGNVYGGGHS